MNKIYLELQKPKQKLTEKKHPPPFSLPPSKKPPKNSNSKTG